MGFAIGIGVGIRDEDSGWGWGWGCGIRDQGSGIRDQGFRYTSAMLPTIDWQGDAVVMVDQRKLPGQEIYVRCRSAQEVARAIRTMVIRGAPAIGVAAAMGIALGMKRSTAKGTRQLAVDFQKTCDMMASTRPTAVNTSALSTARSANAPTVRLPFVSSPNSA